MSARPAVFLDRDGVLNELLLDPVSGEPESPLEVDEVRLIAGAATAAKRLTDFGFTLVCVSNQPAAARGKASVQQLHAVHERVVELLAREHVELAASRLCPHHPEGAVPGLSHVCACRKPAPGMLLDVAGAVGIDLSVSWMVGDSDVDIAAGQAVGCKTALLEYPRSAHKRVGTVNPDIHSADLAEAASQLLGRCALAVGR